MKQSLYIGSIRKGERSRPGKAQETSRSLRKELAPERILRGRPTGPRRTEKAKRTGWSVLGRWCCRADEQPLGNVEEIMKLMLFSIIGLAIIFAGAYFGSFLSHEEEPAGGGSARWDDADDIDIDF